jgi:predicted ATPase
MPLVEILRAASGAVPKEVFLETLGDAAAGVSKLIPGLGDASAEAGAPSEADRSELISACVDFLERTSQRRPLALVLDALQWADESSVRLLESTADRIVDMPAVIIGTFREGELGSGPFAASLPELSKHTSVMRIGLGPA